MINLDYLNAMTQRFENLEVGLRPTGTISFRAAVREALLTPTPDLARRTVEFFMLTGLRPVKHHPLSEYYVLEGDALNHPDVAGQGNGSITFVEVMFNSFDFSIQLDIVGELGVKETVSNELDIDSTHIHHGVGRSSTKTNTTN